MKFAKTNRVLHRWGSILIALPLLVVIATGIILLLKKDVAWVQPPTRKGSTQELALSFDEILAACQEVEKCGISTWSDVDRLDVRPSKGMVKVRGNNRWEVQLDAKTGAVLQVAYRRSDLIESLHDGSFFHDKAKLWVFLPSAVVLLVLWVSGIILFLQPYRARRRRGSRQAPGQPERQQAPT